MTRTVLVQNFLSLSPLHGLASKRQNEKMTNKKYEPEPRLIDDPDKLKRLYDDLSIREIAENHANVGRSMVWNALNDYGIAGNPDNSDNTSSESDVSPDWRELPQ